MRATVFTKNIDGGAFLHVSANTCHCLSIIGFDNIDVVYLHGNPVDVDNYFPSNTNWVQLKTRRILFSIFPLWYHLIRTNPDIIISMPAYVNMAAVAAKILSRFFWRGKLIITEHATMSEKIIEHKNEFFMGNIDKFARVLYKHADALVGVSQGCIFDLKENIGLKSPKMFHVPNPVNLELIRNLAKEDKTAPLHPWLSKDRTTPCFITVGRLAHQKNQTMLIEAFKQVTSKIDARLIVIGKGELIDNLQTKTTNLCLNDFVEFIGHKKNPYPYMKEADCFVLPSSEEGFGLVIVEAMALGTPVLAFDSAGGGPRDVLDNGTYGVLIKTVSAGSLADAMIKIIMDRETLAYFRDQGLLRADYYLPEMISNKWKTLLLALGISVPKVDN